MISFDGLHGYDDDGDNLTIVIVIAPFHGF